MNKEVLIMFMLVIILVVGILVFTYEEEPRISPFANYEPTYITREPLNSSSWDNVTVNTSRRCAVSKSQIDDCEDVFGNAERDCGIQWGFMNGTVNENEWDQNGDGLLIGYEAALLSQAKESYADCVHDRFMSQSDFCQRAEIYKTHCDVIG